MAKNPFTGIRWSSAFTILFGILSLIVGISEMCVWLAVLGVYGTISKDGRNYIRYSHAGVSGSALVLMASCGLWCGLWVFLTGVCGCTMRLSQPSDKNYRTRIVVCISSVANALLFCPIQIGLYAYLFTPVEFWLIEVTEDHSRWWTTMFQAIGIASGVGSLIISIVSTVIAFRIKPYAGREKTWDELQI